MQRPPIFAPCKGCISLFATAIACLDQDGEAALGVNRVARALNIKPPAIYKHLEGNAGLQRAVALTIWQQYLAEFAADIQLNTAARDLFLVSARATREFARSHPARYRVMMHYPMHPDNPEESAIIYQGLQLFQMTLRLQSLHGDALIDVMGMVNAAIYGFILREQAELMTIDRSTDASFEVMLEALLVAIVHLQSYSATV